ncbi:response regulator transcription factor [Bacillus sp. FSL K6-3431]|uniref:response regulator transcription factor n=1 Tax=Bacillus sp. FSL K6-3431 TaxID=2921500 RepID=UPI0030F7F146
MYRLLIVDDEPVIVDSLSYLLSDSSDLELEVYSAYSAVEAMECLNRMKFDIVLTDIRMPKMSGLELQNAIKQLWPNCKVIFLTGYNDFSYIQTAMQNGGYHYILKTDGDEEIIRTIRRAAIDIMKKSDAENMMLKTKQKLNAAIQSLQKDFIVEMINGITQDVVTLERQFQQLDIPLSADYPVYMVLGQVDEWGKCESYSDQSLLMFAIQTITEEFITTTGYTFQSVALDRSKFLLLVQPLQRLKQSEKEADVVWIRNRVFMEGVTESVQSVCKSWYGSTISFALSNGAVSWDTLGRRYNGLKLLLLSGLGEGKELLLTENRSNDAEVVQNQSLHMVIGKIDALKIFVLNGRDEDFMGTFQELLDELKLYRQISSKLKLEVYYSLTGLFLHVINHWDLNGMDHMDIDLMKLIQIQEHDSWDDVTIYFQNLADIIIKSKQTVQHERGYEVIQRVHHYIEANMSGDLSLTRIAENVYLNPQYLSRLYKQVTGSMLSDYLMKVRLNKAKEMLSDRQMKVHEVASALGFDSAAYFTRFFKKNTSLTPIEFRDGKRRSS